MSIDCSPARLGRCYDSFWDRHAVAGSSTVIAPSFTEFLRRVLGARGEDLYWARDGKTYPDAYD